MVKYGLWWRCQTSWMGELFSNMPFMGQHLAIFFGISTDFLVNLSDVRTCHIWVCFPSSSLFLAGDQNATMADGLYMSILNQYHLRSVNSLFELILIYVGYPLVTLVVQHSSWQWPSRKFVSFPIDKWWIFTQFCERLSEGKLNFLMVFT